ncbi:MAG TPA: DUF72 domain-containing protein [Chthoniobacterales bacterium]|nr:DUF72 domain-containing protein [Chthoniobacterales bacterium]
MSKARVTAKCRSRARPGLTGHELRIGISGWRYAGWRGKFYPKDLPQRRELEFAASTFNSIEINGSFYSLQLPSSYQCWRNATPPDFVFAVKGGRFITHMKKLRGVETALANFFASGVLALREKLGPVLWQLPPNLGFDAGRLREFFSLLPRNFGEAASLAKKHDDKLKVRAFARIDPTMARIRLRHAIEVRHESFMTPDFFQLLRQQNIGFVIADTAGKFPYAEDLTADFVYIRLHGAEKLYVSGYDDRALNWWASRINLWRRGRQPGDAKLAGQQQTDGRPRDVFVYFDNDAKVHAPFDAIRLAERLKLRR